MTTTSRRPSAEYVLGHDTEELARLEHQAAVLAPHTKVILERAGLAPGMRVLDIGTGVGDVAFLAGELVGPNGSVLGLDRSEDALARARQRAAERGLTNVGFEPGDLLSWRSAEPFDAVVGRLVLLYVDDPAAAVGSVAELVRPGGIVAFMEYDMDAVRSLPPLRTLERVRTWILEAFARSGHDPALGTTLGAVFAKAGLTPAGSVGLQDFLPPGSPVGPTMAAGVVRTLLPTIERHGIATADEVDISTLETRLRADVTATQAIMTPPALIGAWARVDGA